MRDPAELLKMHSLPHAYTLVTTGSVYTLVQVIIASLARYSASPDEVSTPKMAASSSSSGCDALRTAPALSAVLGFFLAASS